MLSGPQKISPTSGSIKRNTQRASVDLPDPDSPTLPKVSPARKVNAASRKAAVRRTVVHDSRLT